MTTLEALRADIIRAIERAAPYLDTAGQKLTERIRGELARIRVCPYCKAPFVAPRRDKGYCSERCYQNHYFQRTHVPLQGPRKKEGKR